MSERFNVRSRSLGVPIVLESQAEFRSRSHHPNENVWINPSPDRVRLHLRATSGWEVGGSLDP